MKQNKHEQHNDGNLMESIWHYLRILMECMQSFAVGGAIAHFRKGLLLGYFDLQACFDGETFVQGLCASHCIADKHCWRPNQTHAANSCKCWGLLAPKVLLKDHWPTMDGWMGWPSHSSITSPQGEGWRYQISWIFGKNQTVFDPLPSFRKVILQFFLSKNV